MPTTMLVVSGSPNITVPTRMAVMGSKTPSTEAFVAPILRVAIASVAVETIVGSNAKPTKKAAEADNNHIFQKIYNHIPVVLLFNCSFGCYPATKTRRKFQNLIALFREYSRRSFTTVTTATIECNRSIFRE